MRLSEAIRLGAMLRPQVSGSLFKDGGSCVLGAMLEATGTEYDEDFHLYTAALYARWPWSKEKRFTCPECDWLDWQGNKHAHLESVLIHLNNSNFMDHRWTRERIADWVATIEPTEAECAGEPVVAAVGLSSGKGG